jgi:predicted ATP-dependent serine protease
MNKVALILVLFLLFSCRGKKIKSGHWPENRISFGNMGGFTGAHQRFEIFENGQVFFISGTDTAEQRRLKKKEIKEIFTAVSILNDRKVVENKVGNMTNYIVYKMDSVQTEWKWPSSGLKSVPESISHVNQLLIKAVQSKK